MSKKYKDVETVTLLKNVNILSLSPYLYLKNLLPLLPAKEMWGHTLGAAGAIEAVYSILSLMHQEVYPNLNFKQPISSTGLIPVQSYRKTSLQHIMSNSFGFGGNCSSLIFSKA